MEQPSAPIAPSDAPLASEPLVEPSVKPSVEPSVKPSVEPSVEPSVKPLTFYERFTRMMESIFEFIMRKLIFWEKDDKQIGRIIRFVHGGIMYGLIIVYILNHTIFPSYILFVTYYGIFLLIFIQHIICGGCISTTIEQRLIGDDRCVTDLLLEIFHIPTTQEVSHGVVILLSFVFMAMLTFELTLRTILSIQQWFR